MSCKESYMVEIIVEELNSMDMEELGRVYKFIRRQIIANLKSED